MNIGLDEYMDAVNQIEEITDKVNTEHRKITDKEAKKELRLLIKLLEFNNLKVEIEQVKRDDIYNDSVKTYTRYGYYYHANTTRDSYECVIVDDMPSMFFVTSSKGLRHLESRRLIGKTYRHDLSIELDKKWYEDRMYSLAEDLKNID